MHSTSAQTDINIVQKGMIACIRVYRFLLSPWLGQQCRFYPSCSYYTESAIEHYGAIKGIALGIWRILRCNPLHPGGYEPLPCEKNKK